MAYNQQGQQNILGMPTPQQAQPVQAQPVYAQPVQAQPVYAQPVPVQSQPVQAKPVNVEAQPASGGVFMRYQSLPPDKQKKCKFCAGLCCLIVVVIVVVLIVALGKAGCDSSCNMQKYYLAPVSKAYSNVTLESLKDLNIIAERGQVIVNPSNASNYVITGNKAGHYNGIGIRLHTFAVKQDQIEKKLSLPNPSHSTTEINMKYDISGLGVNDNCYCRGTDMYLSLNGFRFFKDDSFSLNITHSADSIILDSGAGTMNGTDPYEMVFDKVYLRNVVGEILIKNGVVLKAADKIEIVQSLPGIMTITGSLITQNDIQLEKDAKLVCEDVQIYSGSARGDIKLDGKIYTNQGVVTLTSPSVDVIGTKNAHYGYFYLGEKAASANESDYMGVSSKPGSLKMVTNGGTIGEKDTSVDNSIWVGGQAGRVKLDADYTGHVEINIDATSGNRKVVIALSTEKDNVGGWSQVYLYKNGATTASTSPQSIRGACGFTASSDTDANYETCSKWHDDGKTPSSAWQKDYTCVLLKLRKKTNPGPKITIRTRNDA